MKNRLRSVTNTMGRRMAGARSLWRAAGMKDEQFGRPIIAIANSFTQFVPGHTHLHDIGQRVKDLIEAQGCYAAEFNTIAVDDGIAMGHDGMLYSLPSREIIADSVEYMANAHCADALVCISNCDKITPGMLMAADLSMRLGWLSPEDNHRIENLIVQAQLPTRAPASLDGEQFLSLMGRDKKVQAGKIRLVLLKGIGEALISDDYDPELLRATLDEHHALPPYQTLGI